MKKTYILLIALVVIIGGIFFFTGGLGSQLNPGKPVIAASIYPVFDIAQNVAGEAADVKLVLPPGASPHTFDPTPEHIKDLQDISVIFTIGEGFDDWASAIAESLEHVRIVDLSTHVNLIQVGEEQFDEQKGVSMHEYNDPHYWLDPENAAMIAHAIEQELSNLNSNSADTYKNNAELYQVKLVELNGALSQMFKNTEAPFITMHDAWTYLVLRYDLKNIASFEQSPGQDPTPQEIAQLTKLVESEDVSVIFSEPQLSTTSLEPLAQDLNLKIVVLDPIGGVVGRDTYIDMMRFNAKQIEKALR